MARRPFRPDARSWRRWLRAPAAILLLGVAAPADAAGPVKIAVLNQAWGPSPQALGLRDGLKELGYREDVDFVLGVRSTQGDVLAVPAAAQDLVRQGVDVIVPGGGKPLEAAAAATATIPIVFVGEGSDPAQRGLVRSLARPGGNVTGVIDLGLELAPKRLEVLREMVPSLRRVFFAYAANSQLSVLEAEAYRAAARRLNLVLVERPVRSQEEARAAFAAIKRGDVHGLLAPQEMAWNIPGFTHEAEARLKLPCMWASPFFVEQGGLASYGPDYYATGRQAARLVDKIIKGARPGDIPVESNPRIELTVNAGTAERIGLRIPATIQARADRVIR